MEFLHIILLIIRTFFIITTLIIFLIFIIKDLKKESKVLKLLTDIEKNNE